MASLFLSYDHEDAVRVPHIVSMLEKAGHSVWWDRHIHGGAEYNNEIEDAVERADAVIVLWSKRSVRSAWVRDEAAEGRDQRKLVPVLLDRVKPPMGFRQYQTIDLARWKKRADDVAFEELLRAIDALDKGGSRPSPTLQQTRFPARRISPVFAAGAAAILLAAIVLFIWRPWSASSPGPSVAVVANDESAASQSLAGNLLIQLGSLQAANSDALHLVEPESSADAQFVFKVEAGDQGDPRASLSLVNNGSNTLLWSREFVQPSGNLADLRQQIAYSAAQILDCTTEALDRGHPELELATLKLFLNGCADLSNMLAQDPRSAVATFKKVTDAAPEFNGGWAKLLLAQIEIRRSDIGDPVSGRNLRAWIASARKFHPGLTEAYLAESWIQSPRPIMGWMRFTDEAVRSDPQHSEALEMHSLGMRHVGRIREAVSDARRAVQSNPLSPTARDALITALMDSGAIEAARNELGAAERLWPGTTNLLNLRFTLEYRYGDPKEAMRMLKSEPLRLAPVTGSENFLAARLEPSAANVERAITELRNAFRVNQNYGNFAIYVQALGAFGRTDDAISELLAVDPRIAPGIIVPLFRPLMRTVRHDPRFMQIAKRFELIPYWQETGIWPDFCSEPDLPYDCKKEAAKLAT